MSHRYLLTPATCPVAVPTSGNGATLHHLSAPIVEGTGETLPGLLGLRTLENLRAILDVDRRMMHLPGPGDVQIILPPGSRSIPLEKAPSGHLVMPIDHYDQIPTQRGGLEPADNLVLTSIPTPRNETRSPLGSHWGPEFGPDHGRGSSTSQSSTGTASRSRSAPRGDTASAWI